MPKYNIIHHSLRLNVNNEQHQRVNGVLSNLNKSIHKSTNQFLIEAVDYYISSYGKEDITGGPIPTQKESGYITRDELKKAKDEIRSNLKDELIRLIGTAIIGNYAGRIQTAQNIRQNEDGDRIGNENETVLLSLTEKWG